MKLVVALILLACIAWGGPWIVAGAIVIAIVWAAIAILGWLITSIRVR